MKHQITSAATKTPNPKVRLKGFTVLVKRLQTQIQDGSFLKAALARENSRQLLDSVHNALKRLNASPADLTPASERAYHKLLALQDTASPPGGQPSRELRLIRKKLTGVNALIEGLQAQLRTADPGSDEAALLGEEIHRIAGSIEDLCSRKGMATKDLAPDSSSFYAWLVFLGRPGALERHQAAIRRFDLVQAEPVRGRQAAPIAAAFYFLTPRFHWVRNNAGISLLLNEGFIDAPAEVYRALAMILRGTRSKKARAMVNAWTLSPAYLAVSRGLAEIREPAGGQGGDPLLLELFSRLNREYFNAELPVPHLAWSARAAYRTLGTYTPASDTITISRIFREWDLPAYLFEFVFYHEMLHKALGSRASGTRHMSHTTEFRRREALFPYYRQAQEYIKSEAWVKSRQARTTKRKSPPSKHGRALL